MKKVICFLVALVGMQFALLAQPRSNASPREYQIGGISVTGVEYLDPIAITSLSGLQIGDKITIPGDPKIGDAVKKLWRQGILGDVKIAVERIEGEKVFLRIELKERPKLSRFFYNGVRKGETETLNDKLPLVPGRIVTPALLKNTKTKIERHYQEKGYLNTTVNIVQVEDSLLSNSVLLKINVNKGKKVKVASFVFEGNEALESKRLYRKFKTKPKNRFRLFASSKFIRAKFEEDKKKLITFYRSQGFRDAQILQDSVYAIDKEKVGIIVRLEEGRKYFYRNITWRGNYIYSETQLSRVLGIQKGDVYDLENLEKRLNFSQTDLDITSLYMDEGYLFFNVEPVEVAIVGDSVDVEMQIFEGPQANINKIIISGNDKTSDKVILREIRTVPGQKFSRTDLIRSQREIANMGYFDPEQIGINPVPNIQDGTVDIEYTLVEKPSDQVELSGGWGGAFGFVGTLGLVFNNFSARKLFKFKDWGGVLPSGDGQRLALRVQANGRRFQTYSFTFTEPWLGGRKPNAFSLNLSHSVQRQILGTETIGSLQVTGLTLSLGRRLTWPDNFFTLSNSITYQRYSLDNFAITNTLRDGQYQNLFFNTTIARNSIDNPTFPRSGSQLSLSLSLTPPYSIFREESFNAETEAERLRYIEYHKWMFDSSWFTRLVGNLVLHTRAHIGYLGVYNRELTAGPFERYVLGGDGLTGQNFLLGLDIVGLRGYENNSITPVGLSGGVVYNKFVMELRYPLSLNPSATIFMLGFFEAGNNFANYAEYSPFDLKRSAGFGARIFMPAFGLIGLDWGYGFDPVIGAGPDASGSQFHFTIGQQIR
ncbi:MAG: outer membrane protein assembly factor BamA [Microscillaceae bacterium]